MTARVTWRGSRYLSQNLNSGPANKINFAITQPRVLVCAVPTIHRYKGQGNFGSYSTLSLKWTAFCVFRAACSPHHIETSVSSLRYLTWLPCWCSYLLVHTMKYFFPMRFNLSDMILRSLLMCVEWLLVASGRSGLARLRKQTATCVAQWGSPVWSGC